MTTEQTISLEGIATREMANDVVSITFQSTTEGKTADLVQHALRENVRSALEVVRPFVKDDEVQVATDSFQVSPKYTKSGKMDGYIGQASITVKGTDTARIAQLASDIKTMIVSGSQNSMSRKLKQSVEAELMKEAIADFTSKADSVAEAFGYKGWTLGSVSVSVNTSSGRNYGGGKVMSLSGGMESAELPIESGKSTMSGNVRGSIILTRAGKK